MKLRIGENEYPIDPDELDIDELAEVEEAIGQPLSEWKLGAKVIKGVAWILIRRDNPDVKYEDIRFKMSDIVKDEADEAPEGKAPSASKRRSART